MKIPISNRIYKFVYDLYIDDFEIIVKSYKTWVLKRFSESAKCLSLCSFQKEEYLILNGIGKNKPIGILKANYGNTF